MDLTQQFMTTAEVAAMLKVSPKAARKLLTKWQVQPRADFGAGRGMGLRWSADDVIEAAEKTSPHRTTNSPRPCRRRAKRTHAMDRPMDLLIKELAG